MAENGGLEFGITLRKCHECDRAEVVRCRDCKYFERQQWGKHEVTICTHDSWFVDCDSPFTEEDGYCFRGERKNEVTE